MGVGLVVLGPGRVFPAITAAAGIPAWGFPRGEGAGVVGRWRVRERSYADRRLLAVRC